MFLCAIVHPRFNPSVNSWWDGKLVIWPIGDWELAKCKSKNRPRGTLVWKNKAVTKEVYRELLISKLLLAIIEKWPWTDRLSRKIYIQQDGAKSHIGEDDKEFNDALAEQDINAELYTQVANSPDVNLLNLGFFQAIQSFNNVALKNEEELIYVASVAYNNYPQEKLNCTWVTLQSVFNQIILNCRDHDYNIEHLSKEKLTNRTIARCIGCGGGSDNIESLQHSYKQSNDEMDEVDMETNLTAERVTEIRPS